MQRPRSFKQLREDVARAAALAAGDAEVDAVLAVTKASNESRYTFGVMYIPGARDSDNEYTDAETLQKACWDYVRKGNLRVRDTHTRQEIGDMVELVSWPMPVTVDLSLPDGTVAKRELPAHTVFAGVVWDPKVWPLVKSGKIRGYSMGGRAVRLREAATDEALPKMASLTGDKPVTKKTDTPDSPVPNKPGVSNWVEDNGGLPPYIRKIAEDLIPKHGTSGAIRLAVGIVKRWARGGGNVSGETRAKAARAVAQWEEMKAKARAKRLVKTADESTQLWELLAAEEFVLSQHDA